MDGMRTKLSPKCQECNHTRCDACELTEHREEIRSSSRAPPSSAAKVVPPSLTTKAVPQSLTAKVVPPSLTAKVVPPSLTTKVVPQSLTAKGVDDIKAGSLTDGVANKYGLDSSERNYRDDLGNISRPPASSVFSDTDSVFSKAVTVSTTASSIISPEADGERLIQLILKDNIIHPLCVKGVESIKDDRFERNLRRLLVHFATELKKEASNQHEKHAALFVRLRARNTAHLICQRLRGLRDSRTLNSRAGTTSTNLGIMNDTSEASESDNSDEDVDDLYYVEDFIRSSAALQHFRDNLRCFVYPQKKFSTQKTIILPLISRNLEWLWNAMTTIVQPMKNIGAPLQPTSLELGKARIVWRCVSTSILQVTLVDFLTFSFRAVDRTLPMTMLSWSRGLHYVSNGISMPWPLQTQPDARQMSVVRGKSSQLSSISWP